MNSPVTTFRRYRALRRFLGPVLAHRLSFTGRA
jgi:hypothetical protein